MPEKSSHIDEQTQKLGNDTEHKPVNEQVKEGAESIAQEVQEEVTGARRSWYQTVRWGRVLLTVDAILLALFALLAWWVSIHPVLSVDVTITREFQENQNPWLHITMLAASYIGSTPLLSTALVILAAAM